MFQIKLANRVIRIQNHYPDVKKLCEQYRVDDGLPFDMEVTVSRAGIEAERQQNGGAFSAGYCESICIYREIALKMPDFDTMLMHMAVISCDGEGYGFAAESGTGKSTHIALWKKRFGDRVTVINGDKPLVVYRRDSGSFLAFGTPWCGKEGWGGNCQAPLRGICFLTRGEENSIRPMEEGEVLSRIFHQLLVPEQETALERQLELLDILLRTVPFYELTCNILEEAAETAYAALRGGRE